MPQSNSYPLSLCLGFSFSSHLIVLVEVRSSEVGSSKVGSSEVGLSGKVSLSEKVVLELRAVEAGAIKEGSGGLCHQGVCHQDGLGILPSKASVVDMDSGLCRQGWCRFLKHVKGHLASGLDSVHGRCGRQSRPRELAVLESIKSGFTLHGVRSGFAPYPAGKLDLGSLHTL